MRMPHIEYAVRSDKGCIRRNNEDNLFCCGITLAEEVRNFPFKLIGKTSMPSVFAVFDGIGGEQYGEQASLAAAQTLSLFSGKMCVSDWRQIDYCIHEYVSYVNRRIRKVSSRLSARMGTTMAIVVISDDIVRAYNIGDSRIYKFDKQGLKKISVDHTLVAAKIKTGFFTEEQLRRSNEWAKLTACLGIERETGGNFAAEINPAVTLSGKTRFLLCSDGLTDMVFDNRIEDILSESKTAEIATASLMSEALNNGGKDNITVMAIDITHRHYLFRKFMNLVGKR